MIYFPIGHSGFVVHWWYWAMILIPGAAFLLFGIAEIIHQVYRDHLRFYWWKLLGKPGSGE